MKNVLLVGGTFDSEKGKPSKIVSLMAHFLGCMSINGGTLDTLKEVDFRKVDALIWMPNISNHEDKILPMLKKLNPKMVLVSSKRVVDGNYGHMDIVGRLLSSRSNLGIVIDTTSEVFSFSILDPLGNEWCNTDSISAFGYALKSRLSVLMGLTRQGSMRVSPHVANTDAISQEFVDVSNEYANEFSKIVTAYFPERFLGNASTRCSSGFPASRSGDGAYVTRRNINKQGLTKDGFVSVHLKDGKVGYYGDHKPSVDTPIQLKIFNEYKNINYMIHGHVYIDGAQFTDTKVPCGALEEFTEIRELVALNATKFAVNLRGHGCLFGGATVGDLKGYSLIARPLPEKTIKGVAA